MNPKSIVAVLASSAAHDAALTRAESLARWYGAELHVVSDGASIRDIADSADRASADLVVVPKKARPATGYWSAASFAAAVGKAVRVPTIVVPAGGARRGDADTPFTNILAAIDFSEASRRALADALVLAQQSGGRLRLLHVLDGFPYQSVYSASLALRLRHEFLDRVARVNRRLYALIPPDAFNWSEIDVATVSGLTAEAIVSAASEQRADLIVLGLPRRSRLEEIVTGSTVHGVVRRATAPVLLVGGSRATNDASTVASGEWSASSSPPSSSPWSVAGSSVGSRAGRRCSPPGRRCSPSSSATNSTTLARREAVSST